MRKPLPRGAILFVALICISLFRFLPAPQGMTASAMQVLGIFIGILLLWMTLSIDWPSLLCIAAVALVPEMSMGAILSGSVGNPTFSFLLFTFLCTHTLGKTPFVRRCALAFVTGKIARKGPWAFVISYFASVLFLGSFMSPTVLVILFLTITEEMFSILGLEKGDPVAMMMTTGMVFCSGIAAGMTPIAHVFPVLSMNVYQSATGNTIGTAQYMAAGIPVGLLAAAVMLLVFRLLLRPDLSRINTAKVNALMLEMPPMERREKLCVFIFFSVVAHWILPAVIKPVFPALSALIDSYGIAMPPLLGACAMAILSVDGVPLLDFKEAAAKGVPWASLIMVAGTLSLGAAMTHAEIGLTTWVSGTIQPFAARLAPASLVLLFTFWAAVQTNLSSNMVTATVVATIAMPVLQATGGAVNPAAVIAMIGMISAYAFATPPAMATIVFAIGSGWTGTAEVAKYGSILMLAGALLACLVGYPIAALLM